MNAFDVVIVGGGAAGLSAALVLSRARRRVLVVDSGSPRNGPAAHLHGFLSRDGMPPADLLAAGREEVRGYGGIIVTGAVTAVDSLPGSFQVRLADSDQVSARRLLVATGLHDELPSIPGLRERWGRDVLHCPYCHGWEVRDLPLAVLWHGPDTVRYAQIVRQWSDDVVLFTQASTLTAAQRSQLVARAIGIVEGDVSEVVAQDDHLAGVRLSDGRVIPRRAVFVPPRFVPESDLLAGLGCDLDEQGWVTTDATGATTMPGVWVAGNVANPRAQLITAAGEGSAAAIAINAALTDEDVAEAVRELDNSGSSQLPAATSAARLALEQRSTDTNNTQGAVVSTDKPEPAVTTPRRVGPPSKHQLALMIWLCVFPTLTVINLALADWLATLSPVPRTFVLATVAVPVVIYGLMPQLHKARARLVMRMGEN